MLIGGRQLPMHFLSGLQSIHHCSVCHLKTAIRMTHLSLIPVFLLPSWCSWAAAAPACCYASHAMPASLTACWTTCECPDFNLVPIMSCW